LSERGAKLEPILSWILIGGVLASLVAETFGLALDYAQTGSVTITLTSAWNVHSINFFSYVTTSLPPLLAGRSAVGFVALGIILLMLTPYVRVVASVIYYGATKDYRYFGITLLVLVIITISLLAL
jgi:uncharacterized membrane protein